MGLGLAIVRRLAKLLDHDVTVESRPGAGSCFRIDAPRAADAVHAFAGNGQASRAPDAQRSTARWSPSSTTIPRPSTR